MIESWGDAPDFGLDDVPVIRPGLPVSRRYAITPVTKPRQTKSDKWNERPCVVRYREYADKVRSLGIEVMPTGSRIIFVIPMPESWSSKKKAQMLGQPHQQAPDKDNLEKALMDAIYSKRGKQGSDDSHIYHNEVLKFWGAKGAIIIQEIQQALCLDGDQIVWKEM